jgi:hypothetical protein
MSPKDIALLYRHPLLVLNFYWLSERYHAAHYICHVQQHRQAELSRSELIALIDHYRRMSGADFVEEFRHVEPCLYCDLSSLFEQRDRRTHHEHAAA